MVFRCLLASLYEVVSVGWSIGPSVGPSVRPAIRPSVGNSFFQMPKMSGFLCENYRDGPTLTLLNVLGVLGVLSVLNVLGVLSVLNVLNMLMDASLACWALFTNK